MGTAPVSPGNERRAGGGQAGERIGGAFRAGNPCRVAGRADDDEVVVHDLAAVDAVALTDELALRCRIMDQQQVCIAAPREIEGLAGADRDDLDAHASGGGHARQQVAE